VKNEMDNKVKTIPFLTVIAIVLVAISMISATQYVSVHHRATSRVTIEEPYICLLAKETDITGSGYALNATATGGTYYLKMGNWLPDTTISFTCGFAVVNNNSLPVRMAVRVEGNENSYVNITVHANSTQTTNGTLATSFSSTKDTTNETLWGSGGLGSVNNWDLGPMQGYLDTYEMNGTYRGVNDSAVATKDRSYYFTATWDSTDYVYVYDTTNAEGYPADGTASNNFGVRQHTGNTYDTFGSNYVWVEVIVGIPATATINNDIDFNIYFDFQVWTSLNAL